MVLSWSSRMGGDSKWGLEVEEKENTRGDFWEVAKRMSLVLPRET